jgi:hypothetical protein
MKKIILIGFLFLFSTFVYSQGTQAKKEASVRKIIPDTIIDPDIYLDKEMTQDKKKHKQPRFNGTVNVSSIEVKNGLFYVSFTAKVKSKFDDVKIIKDGQIVDYNSENGKLRTYTPTDSRKNFIYVTPATNGKIQTIKTSGWSLGLLSIPFKIRPSTDTIHSETKADVKNVMVMIGRGKTWERYFSSGTTSRHKVSGGLLVGPSVESLTPSNTENKILKANPTNQVYLSTAFGLCYSYNDKISFAIVPIGADTGFSNTAKKWIYNGNYWWGFGIGLDISGLKIF